MPQQPDIWKPALLSGAIFGFASAIPLVSLLNCLCCSLIVGSGILTSWLIVRGSTVPLSYGMAALGGAVSGAAAAVVWGVAQLLLTAVLQRDFSEEMREAAERAQQMTGGEDAMRIVEGIAAPVLLAMASLILIVLWAPFGLAGGVIGRAVFERRAPLPPEPSSGLDTTIK